MNFDNLRIAHKLWATMLMLFIAMTGVAGVALYRAHAIEGETAAALASANRLTAMATRWKGMTETAIARGMASSMSSDPAVGDLFKANLASDTPVIVALRGEIGKLADSEDDKRLLAHSAQVGKALIAASKRAAEMNAAGDWSAVAKWVNAEYATSAQTYLASIDAFVTQQARKVEAAQQAAASAAQRSMAITGAAALIVLAFSATLTALMVRSIRRPLQHALTIARAIAAGDLTQRIDAARGDEFGELMKALVHMNDALATVVGEVRASTDSIGTASSEIASGNADLSRRTESTASSLQQTASSMEQLTGTVHQSAAAANTANDLAVSATRVAQRGGEVVGQVVSTMAEINTSSKKIADIIGVIDGIAFQTNILALNAAVEAARAGEQGRGFAVVASEVRSLAQRSAAAAKEIKGLIGASVDKVESGSRLVSDAGATMQEIVASVQRVTDIIGEISHASREQSQGIGQVNGAVTQLDQMTQQNAALVEQSAAAADSLRMQAGKLAAVVDTFRLRGSSVAA